MVKAKARFSGWVKRRTPSANTGSPKAAPSGKAEMEQRLTKSELDVRAEPKRAAKEGIVPRSRAVRRSTESITGLRERQEARGERGGE